MKATWPMMLKYPQCVSLETSRMLDALEDVLPLPAPSSGAFTDRFSMWLSWLGDARKKGLLTNKEFHTLQADLARNI